MPKPPLQMITKGNSKLGKTPYHVNLPSGISCPGATEWCLAHCYTGKGNFLWPKVASKYGMNLKLWTEDAPGFERQLMADISQLKDGSLFRFHVSGDIASADYARMIGRIVSAYPAISFWLYTRSYRVDDILPEIERLETDYPNLKVWRSTDSSVEPQPDHRDARTFDTAIEAKTAGYTVCPEQTGVKESCADCGLCFKISKPVFKLAFVKH